MRSSSGSWPTSLTGGESWDCPGTGIPAWPRTTRTGCSSGRSASCASRLGPERRSRSSGWRSRSTSAPSAARFTYRRSSCTGKETASVTWATGRFLAEQIHGATYRELPGDDHMPWMNRRCRGDPGRDPGVPHGHARGTGAGPDPDHGPLRDSGWAPPTSSARSVTPATASSSSCSWPKSNRESHGYRGHEVDAAGDGFFASFDGPARAIRCAQAVAAAAQRLGLAVRLGVHTGEVEVVGDKLAGIAVHIGARIGALAEGNEVLVSSTVRDIVAGSGLRFLDRGPRALKGG